MSNMRKLEGRVPFYIAGQSATEIAGESGHPWHGPDDYLEHAIRSRSSDAVLEFLQSGLGRDVVSAMELHHQRHGEIAWRHCRDIECHQLGLMCAQLAILEALRREMVTT